MTKEKFYSRANNAFLMWLFLLLKLPGAAFMGVRLKNVDAHIGETKLAYRWRSQNPFKSTYFAAQIAAAELSTGILVLGAIQEQPPISMLVTRTSGQFFKKADQTLRFVCKQGAEVTDLIEKAVKTGEGQQITLLSEGFLPDGTLASSFEFEWSVRVKRR